jgi:hypothetical protein
MARSYGFRGEVNNSNTEEHWLNLVRAAGGKWAKVIKYKLNAFYAFHRQQPLPTPPFEGVKDLPGTLIGGQLGRWFRLFLERNSLEERVSLLTSVLNSKKGMPRSSTIELRQAERDLIADLTGEPKLGGKVRSLAAWGDVDTYHPKIELTLSRLAVQGQLRRTVRELYGRQTFTHEDRVKAFFPSTSANYIRSRKNAGAIGVILEHPTLLQGLRKFGGYLSIDRHVVKEEERIESEDRVNEAGDIKGFKEAFETLWIRILSLAREEKPFVEPVALAEALKNRVITKGPPFTQTALRALWKKMHSVLKHHPAFSLLGTPQTPGYILERMGEKLKDDEGYLSGDYEAATNNLESWVSETIADAICEELNIFGFERNLLKRSLTGHIFLDKDMIEDLVKEGKFRMDTLEDAIKRQTTGQLMGSITSFPILCIANAAMSRWAYELDTKRITPLRQWPGMINGDDIAMKCTVKGFEAWKVLTEFVGLKQSIGKTYYSREFVNINSTNYQRDAVNPSQTLFIYDKKNFILRRNPFKETKYVNMGLMFGLKRSGASIGLNDQDDPRNNIGTRYRELIRSTPITMREDVHKRFIQKHWELLTSTNLPWFVPEWIGGLGLLGVEKPSELDLRIAHQILYNWKKIRPISLAHSDANWKTWKLAEERVPKPFYVREKNQGVELYNKFVGDKVIDLLFDSNITLKDLFQEVKKGMKTNSAIKHNASLWSAKRYKSLPGPLSYDDLLFKPIYNSYENEQTSISLISPLHEDYTQLTTTGTRSDFADYSRRVELYRNMQNQNRLEI